MNKIPTAEELVLSTGSLSFWREFEGLKTQLIKKIIDQNKLHVETALEKAKEEVVKDRLSYEGLALDTEIRILNAYPLENIR